MNFRIFIAAIVLITCPGKLSRLVSAETYEVGVGKPFRNISDVPWETLEPGDTVLIHWRPEPIYFVSDSIWSQRLFTLSAQTSSASTNSLILARCSICDYCELWDFCSASTYRRLSVVSTVWTKGKRAYAARRSYRRHWSGSLDGG